MSDRISRRTFLAAVGGTAIGGTALGHRYFGRPAGGESDGPPARLLIIHKPCGTVPESYDCAGGELDFSLSPILEPFAPVREHMVVVEGLDITKRADTPGQDHGNGMVTFMTGGVTIKAPGFRAVIADRASIDQILAADERLVGASPIRSLQLAADVRSDRDEVFVRVLSYADRARPVAPEARPAAAFARVFGGLLATGDEADLDRELRRRRSVLDYGRDGVRRLSARVGAAERIRLESHLDAIRETEALLDRSLACTGPDLAALGDLSAVDLTDDLHGEVGLAHLEIIRAAFQCDLTRIATFMWAPGNSRINFSRMIPGVEDLGHHVITHRGANPAADEAAIHRWYNQQMAGLIARLRDTADLDGGSLLDNTLVLVFSEVRLGSPHTFDNVPIQIFGGANLGLAGGRKLDFGGRSTNDLWLTIAGALGAPMECFGLAEHCAGELPGLFV